MFRILCFLLSALSVTGNLIFPSFPIPELFANNSLCAVQCEIYKTNLENSTLWAMEMWDATAKSTTGVLRGSIFQMGHFDQCLTVEAPFASQYCLVQIQANIPKPNINRDEKSLRHDPYEHVLERLYPYNDISQQKRNLVRMAWCIPAGCAPQDLEKIMTNYINNEESSLKKFNVTFDVNVPAISCHSQEENVKITAADILFCAITLTLTALVVVSTICEWAIAAEQNPKNDLPFAIFFSFSAKKNFEDLARSSDSEKPLAILHGIKTICIFCIILDHRFGTFTSSALLNFNYVETQYRAPFAPFLFHGDLLVDTFFLAGGLLVSYCLLNEFDKKRINPGFIILMRYARLTPVYAFVVFYYATIFNYTGSGPLWKIIAGQDSEDCKNNWWTNLLYISNYVNADHMCMTHSWYLPCDFHYFIIALGVCLLIKKHPKLGLWALAFLTFLSMLIPFLITWIFERPALMHFYPEFLTGPKVHPDFLLTYSKSHTRATPYMVGMFAGYCYYKWQDQDKNISQLQSVGTLLLSLLLIVISILAGIVFYDPYHAYNVWESATYAGLHRAAFACGTFGIIYVTSYGQVTFIKKILVWSPWVSLSKLVYGAYLIHMQFQLRAAAKFMNPREITYFDVVSLSLSDMVLAFASALVLYLLVEAPFRRIFKQLLTPKKAPTQRNNLNGTKL